MKILFHCRSHVKRFCFWFFLLFVYSFISFYVYVLEACMCLCFRWCHFQSSSTFPPFVITCPALMFHTCVQLSLLLPCLYILPFSTCPLPVLRVPLCLTCRSSVPCFEFGILLWPSLLPNDFGKCLLIVGPCLLFWPQLHLVFYFILFLCPSALLIKSNILLFTPWLNADFGVLIFTDLILLLCKELDVMNGEYII